jgi:Ca2+-binding RTX toxin-like protein
VLGINFENLTLTGSANLSGTGNAAANIITGNSGNNFLAGLGGGDTLDGGTGLDTATYVSSLGAVTVSLSNGTGTGGDAQGDVLSNIENLTGSAFGDCLQGDGAGNSLIGNDGGDTLDGGAGTDSMAGGLGDDTYIVDSALDLVTESSNQGVDTIVTAVNYTLPNNVENLAFSAVGAFVGSGNSNPNMIVGGGADDSLSGLSGNDTLDGGAGADTMVGGANDDTYWMDKSGDQIVEASNGGTDTILFLISSATLAANTENLTFAGTGDATATGNILANILIGGAGNDSLDALDGNDTLDGNAGADHMAGGLGNDLYKVDNAGDQVIEASGGGTDTVLAALNNYVLAANVENLSFVGAGNFTGAGNILANAIAGGAGDDALDGSDGNDTLDGGAGGDSLTLSSTAPRTSSSKRPAREPILSRRP